MRAIVISFMFLTVGVADCARADSGGTPASARHPDRGSSGIQGTVSVDIGCPHVTGTPCPRTPLRARLVIRPAGPGGPVVSAHSGPDGRFRVPLAPGRYTIQPLNIDGAPVPTAFPVSVTVHPGGWTTLPVEFDSGIR
jgi:hypothetical protein